MNELELALDKVTIKLLESLGGGDIVGLTENFDLYRYELDEDDEENDCIVVIDTAEDEEIYCVLYSKKLKQIIFEAL